MLCSVPVFDSISKPATRQTKSDVALVAASSQSLIYSGPLPPASEMDKYEKICSGALDRILKMAEQQAKHRQNIEAIAVKTSSERSLLGVKYAFYIAIAAFTLSGVCFCLGQIAAGGIIFGSTLVSIVKDPSYKNRNWKAEELEPIIEAKVKELLRSPSMAEELMTARKPEAPVPVKNIELEKRIREIDRQINKLMELYQRDDIPIEVLGESINKLYNEKLALQNALEPVPVESTASFDLVQELIADAVQIWDFADKT